MSKITPEDTHALVEKLIEYVMNEVPTNKVINEKFEQVDKKFEQLNKRLEIIEDQKADKKDIEELKGKVNLIISGMDKQAQQLDNIRTEQVATNSALLRHEERITALEAK